MSKKGKINLRRIIILIGFLLLALVSGSIFSRSSEAQEYAAPTWMDNEHIICVKYANTVKSRLFGWFGDISDARNIVTRQEIQIVSMDIEGKNEKLIKNIIIDRPGLSYKWKEEIFKGTLRIESIAYSQKKRVVAFSTHGYTNALFIVKDDGTGEKKISNPAGGPYFSPDGKYLQYTSNYKVWLYDLNTEESMVLIEDAVGGPWSPDGKKIAISRKEKDKPWQYDAYIFDLETKTVKDTITHLAFVKDWKSNEEFLSAIRHLRNPRVSPDGTKIVGEPHSDPIRENGRINYIGICDIDDKNLKVLRYYAKDKK